MNKFLITVLLSLIYVLTFSQTEKQFVKAGEEAYANGDYYEAIAYFEQALKFDKDDANALQKVALSYYELKDYENAERFFDKLEKSESFPLLGFYKANNYKLLGKYPEAKAAFQAFFNAYAENDFYKQKAIHEVASCSWALDQVSNDEDIIYQFKKPLNTGYSDFAAAYIDSNTLQLSSLQTSKKNMKDEFQGKIFFFELEGKNATASEDFFFPTTFTDSFDVANGFYLAEQNEFYFSKCSTVADGEKLCDIYVMNLKGKAWSEARRLSINTTEFTETQATAYVNEEGQTVLYFVSDRLGGYGKLDIYRSVSNVDGSFTNPINAGTRINSVDNESTPYFDQTTQTLYFSSEWHYGFGGYDIFKSKFSEQGFAAVQNLGEPINSCANDQYYYPTPYNHALFASNRKGALQLRGSACCYDVFAHLWEKTELGKDTPVLLANKEENKDRLSPTDVFINSLQEQVPITVYFHNDEPNPKSTATKTTLTYAECHEDYKAVKADYFDEFQDNQAIGAWFNTIDEAYTDLQGFLETLEMVLPTTPINLRIEGYCSPLAMNDYNINLAKRRIVSLQNHILSWSNGVLKPYFDAGDLTFAPAPFGEEKAATDVSDSYENVKQSIYNPKAAVERRVAIIGVELR